MKNLIKSIFALIVFATPVYAQSSATLKTPNIPNHKKTLNRAFVGTKLKGRIVNVSLEKQVDKTFMVVVAWHPKKMDEMLNDMLVIMETVDSTIPRFSSVSLQAIRPSCANNTSSIIWEASITKNSFSLLQERRHQKLLGTQPIPLYQQ